MGYLLKIIIAFIVLFVTIFSLTSGCSAFGTRPDASDRQRFEASPQFDKKEEIFVNRRPGLMDEIYKRFTYRDYMEALLGGNENRRPHIQLPDSKPDLNEFLKTSENIKVIWFGHSTVLINLAGKIILLDPNFSENASPISFTIERFQNPALALSELPPIDYIVVSHDHYDHLDMRTAKFFKDKNTRFVVPLGIGADLIGWGVKKENITELDWWKNFIAGDVEFIATPAQHASKRDVLHSNETLWASWIIRTSDQSKFNQSIFYSGDSGYDVHFKNVGDKYGPFDVAFIENGQYNEKWHEVHLLPDEIIQAYVDVKARRLFPVHWGMFDLAPHAWYEPIATTSKTAKEKGIQLITPKFGEIVEVTDEYKSTNWWEEFM